MSILIAHIGQDVARLVVDTAVGSCRAGADPLEHFEGDKVVVLPRLIAAVVSQILDIPGGG